MTVVAAYVYSEGRRTRPVSLDDAGDLALAPGEFVWIGIVDPDDAELEKLQRHFNLHPIAVRNAHKPYVLPKIEIYDEEIFVVARTAQLVGEEIAYGKTAILVGNNHIITMRTGSQRQHTDLRAQLEASPHLLKHGVDYVLHGVLDFIVDGYGPIVEAIEDRIADMERRALDTFLSRAEISRIFGMRRELIRFRRIMGPTEEVLSRLSHLEVDCIDAQIQPYFRDVTNRVRRIASMIEGLREILSSVLEASSLLEQQRQGTITRQLAAWAAILAVPTAIAGIYGMNFQYMPELGWKYGYHLTVAVILSAAGFLYWRFRRSGWL
ncbi:magnesium transporter [Aureimonas sp. SA4125]|uniref:magnesium and cobalt transport protein CorA n=1 Tax=Aureimonas sp. SA4125 TaxID=2826993 RepID=UPI001CC41E0F|nr:magnesium and cobalt transport protein CorA [Aureimonas sp. SA4125]BDA85817.1 magnesium transporter [Aureimonas sp. SA4125]